jgi:hypothetical protein
MLQMRTGLALAALLPAMSAAAAEPTRYEGVCEASAAAVIDATHFAVASDETERLTIYERGNPVPIATHSLSDVTDIEAAARIGDIVFWTTSHSLNKDREDKAKRKVLFATSVAGASLDDAGKPFAGLRKKAAELLGVEEASLKGALNIEGLAATPEGDLLAGLRGPLKDSGEAIILRIDDPLALVGLGDQPAESAETADPVFPVNLDGRGIRSIERVGTGEHAYLIVAGSTADAGLPPALFWWDGLRGVLPGPAASLEGLVPEAILAWSDHDVQILGDNGGTCSDEGEGPRWFPSIDVTF